MVQVSFASEHVMGARLLNEPSAHGLLATMPVAFRPAGTVTLNWTGFLLPSMLASPRFSAVK